MTDRSAFTDDEWRALTEAPLRITLALVSAGEHGPISVVKEAAARARAIARPSEHGPADALIAEIAKEAESREARHDVQAHHGRTVDQIVDDALSELAPVAAALGKLTPDEVTQVRAWLLDIANAVAAAAKSVTPAEQAVIDRIASTLQAPAT
jgi:hypothetical protein